MRRVPLSPTLPFALALALAVALALIAGIAIGRQVERVGALSAEPIAPGAETVVIGKALARVKLESALGGQGRSPRLSPEDLRPARRKR